MSAGTDSLIGRQLGEFVIRERLQAGGFGVVYLADQPALERTAVIKVLHGHMQASADITRRFLLEARLAGRLEHPYAAHIYAFGAESDGLLWLAMEWVRGTPLSRVIKTQGPLPTEQVVRLVSQLAEVLSLAHERGIAHRDIKPQNVMVVSRGGRMWPKLLDFGIAKVLTEGQKAAPMRRAISVADESANTEIKTAKWKALRTLPAADAIEEVDEFENAETVAPAAHTRLGTDSEPEVATLIGSAFGSPPYMPPEQWIDASSAGPAADQYSLAILAYEALSGSPPFTCQTLEAYSHAHRTQPIPPLANCPDALSKVLLRALEKDPAERYATMTDFAAAWNAAAPGPADTRFLPSLDEDIGELFEAEAPQPISETVAAISGARNEHRARDAIVMAIDVITRYLGCLALAAHARLGSEPPQGAGQTLTRRLCTKGLTVADWFALCEVLVAPYRETPDAYPIPELVLVFDDKGFRDSMDLLRSARDTMSPLAGDTDALREWIRMMLASLSTALRRLEFVCDYQLVVPREDGRADRWMGVRRAHRSNLPLSSSSSVTDEPLLASLDGRAILALSPIVTIAKPSSDRREELFFVDGPGRRGMSMIAWPDGYERDDERSQEWIRSSFLSEVNIAPAATRDHAPYRGLAPLTEEDAERFFGREREVESFRNRLRVTPALFVVGPSGAGKSSFIHAGVLPNLDESWFSVKVRPGANPVDSLLRRLAKHELFGEDDAKADDDPSGFAMAIHASLEQRRKTLVLVVDQFEELFTLCEEPTDRLHYAEILEQLASSADVPFRLIVTVRDDFLTHVEGLPPLRGHLVSGLQLLGTPALEDLRRIVVSPAERSGYSFDDDNLPLEMAKEIDGLPGALPLLAFTAEKLWQHRDQQLKQLTRSAYEKLGGVGGALAEHAESVLAQLGPDDRKLVQEAFRHLVTADGTRAVLHRDDLTSLLGGDDAARMVINHLIDSRLLVTSDTDSGRQSCEIIHEALLSEWPRLKDWLRADAEGALLRDQLRAAARQWDDRGRPGGMLWRGDALAALNLWRSKHNMALAGLEEEFVGQSQRADKRGRILRRSAVIAILGLAAIFSAFQYRANMKTEAARLRAEESERQSRSRLAESYAEQGRVALLNDNPGQAAPLIRAAMSEGLDSPGLRFMMARTMESMEHWQRMFDAQAGMVWHAEFLADGARILSVHDDGFAVVWDTSTGNEYFRVGDGESNLAAAAVSPDGSLFATGGLGRFVRLWDARNGNARGFVEIPEGGANTLSFDSTGQYLLIAASSGAVVVWNWSDGTSTTTSLGSFPASLELLPDASGALAFSGQAGAVLDLESQQSSPSKIAATNVWGLDAAPAPSSLLATSEFASSSATVWDRRTNQAVATLAGHEARIEHISFSPSGELIVTTSRDRTARVWDAATGALKSRLSPHRGTVWYAEFDSDSKRVITAGDGGSLALWDVETGTRIASLSGHVGTVFRAHFSPKGDHILSVSWDGLLHLWKTPSVEAESWLDATSLPCAEMAPHGRWLTFACAGATRVWDTVENRLHAELPGSQWVAVSPDGTRIATATEATVTVHQPRSASPSTMRFNYEAAISGLVWIDGSRLATVDVRGNVTLRNDDDVVWSADVPVGNYRIAVAPNTERLWVFPTSGTQRKIVLLDSSSGEEVGTVSPTDSIYRVFFNPDGTRAVALSTIPEIFDTATGKSIATLAGHASAVNDAAFSRDGRFIATAGADGAARIWRSDTGQLVSAMTGTPQFLVSVDWSPSGQLLLTFGGDGVARYWEPESGRLLWERPAYQGFGYAARFAGENASVTIGDNSETRTWLHPWPTSSDLPLPEIPCWAPWQFNVERGRVMPRQGAGCQ